MELGDSLKAIKGIGDKTAALFEKLGIHTISDLFCHYPMDYEEFALPCAINELKDGEIRTVEATVTRTPTTKSVRNLKILTANVSDHTGDLRLTWFNQPYLMKQLRVGTHLILRGKVSRKGNNIQIDQPKLYSREEYAKLIMALQPRYHLTAGLSNNAVSKAMDKALAATPIIKDYLSSGDAKELSYMSFRDALFQVHFPKNRELMLEARKRLVFDEFLFFMVQLKKLKSNENSKRNINRTDGRGIVSRLSELLPYELTQAQKRVLSEIFKDMSGEFCMNRLVEGDVGSGKTIVAIAAMIPLCEEGHQCALMAPTEVLARQHFSEVSSFAEKFGLKACILTGSMKVQERRDSLRMIESGEADIVVGTHALLEDRVVFRDLALVVADEQHRFGVRQREILSEKGEAVHSLVMSATPIPRSLAIILYGELSVSRIDELPKRRLPVKTAVVDTGYREKAYRFLSEQVGLGHQAYVVCPMIEESENLDVENVTFYTEKLKEALPPSVRIECLHGKMDSKEKNLVCERFAEGAIDILVSTTVIEVGINVPNATVMMVENSERFGLATLHQLRGRVGRGEAQSYCIYVSGKDDKATMDRLMTLSKFSDGFKIAEEDLRQRGPGDIFGIRQSGDMSFRLADIYNDAEVLKKAAAFADRLSEGELERLEECPQFRSLQLIQGVVL